MDHRKEEAKMKEVKEHIEKLFEDIKYIAEKGKQNFKICILISF